MERIQIYESLQFSSWLWAAIGLRQHELLSQFGLHQGWQQLIAENFTCNLENPLMQISDSTSPFFARGSPVVTGPCLVSIKVWTEKGLCLQKLRVSLRNLHRWIYLVTAAMCTEIEKAFFQHQEDRCTAEEAVLLQLMRRKRLELLQRKSLKALVIFSWSTLMHGCITQTF